MSSSSQISTDLSSEDIPAIYTNALHVAVEYEAEDVAKLLLKYHVDPESKGVLSAVNQSNYVNSSVKQFDNIDNNFNAATARARSTGLPQAAENSVITIRQYEPDGGHDESGASSNNSSTNRVYCPLHYLPKSISSSLLLKNSPASSSSRSAASFSPQKFASANNSPLKFFALKQSAERGEIKEDANCDERDSGKRRIRVRFSINLGLGDEN